MSESLPFDPDNLTPSASLNRVRIVDAPGIKIDPHVRGKTGYDLLSSSACAQLVHAYTADLGLNDAHESEPVRFLDQGLQSDDMRIRRAAEKVGMQLGRHLGYLLAVLKRGDPVNRLERADWDTSYWKQWAEIRDVFLGGGIVQGRLGSLMCEHATNLLDEAGVRDCTLHLALHPLHLPLIGAARSAQGGLSAALVFDFGNSFIARVIADTVQEVQSFGLPYGTALMTSMACYMRNGQPLPRQGSLYAQLEMLSPNLSHMLSSAISELVKQPLTVKLLHDGTAAARTYAGHIETAVITLGTALGVGFAPRGEHLRPLDQNLILSKDLSLILRQSHQPGCA